MTAPVVRKHTDAVVAKLRDALSVSVGDGVAPDGEATKYVVVYKIPGGGFDGTLADAHRSGDLTYQISAVGNMRDQAEAIADAARAVMFANDFTIEGRAITHVRHVTQAGVTRDDDVRPVLYVAVDRYALHSVPAA